MAWSETLLDLRFRGIAFDCISTQDEASRALVEHAYPYRDGAEIEDLGANAAKLSVRTLIYGPDYERLLQELMAALDTAGAGELVHPVFGLMQVNVARYRTVHDAESPDQAQLEIDFVESAPRNPFFDVNLPQAEIAAVGTAVDAATAALALPFASQLQAIASGGLLARIELARNQMEGHLLQFRGMVSGIQSSGLDLITTPTVFIADLTSCVQAVQQMAYALTGSAQSTAQSFDLVKTSLTQASQPLPESTTPASVSAAFTQDAELIAAQVQAVAALALADAAGAAFAQEQATPAATPVQLENMSAVARTELQAAITTLRTLYPQDYQAPVEALKNVAASVQLACRAALLARPPMIRRTVELEGCLRQLAHRWYGDHTRAAELLRLNSIPNPNFIPRGQVLYAYSK